MAKLKAQVKPFGFRKMLSNFSKKIKELESFEKARGEYWQQAQAEIGEMYVRAVQQNLKGVGTGKRTGRLQESITAETDGKTIKVFADPSFFQGTDENGKKLHYYAPWVEEGTSEIIVPKHNRPLTFYNPYGNYVNKVGLKQEWFSLPWVHGQHGQHYMRRARDNKKLQQNALEIMRYFAMQCIAVTSELSAWRNKSGNRRGINFTSGWRKVHGSKGR